MLSIQYMYIILIFYYVIIINVKCNTGEYELKYMKRTNKYSYEYSMNNNKQTQCIQLSNDLHKLIEQSELIISGRLKQHDIPMKKSTSTRILYDDDDDNVKTYFNITVLIKTLYKSNYPVDNQIIIGSMFLANNKHYYGIGCLKAFYPNAKYIFFLRRTIHQLSNYYEPLSEAIEFTEQIEKQIYTHYCHNCVKPTIESIPNQVIEYGYALTVSCSATGTPTPNIIWIRDGKSINLADKSVIVETFERSSGYVESILEINNIILIDTGEYWCYAENALGIAKEKFILKVQQNNTTNEKVMADELIPCSDEYKDYCLNGGQCYTYKNERGSFQCRCIDHYFGDRCHFHTDGLYGIYNLPRAYSESRGYDIQTMLHELATTLTLRGVFFTLFGASISVLTFYGIWKCQQRSMHRRYLKKRNKSSSKPNSQMKFTHPVTKSNHGNRMISTINDSTDPFLLNELHKREQNIDTVRIQEDYIEQPTDGYILTTTNLFNSNCYVNHSQNCTQDLTNDLKLTNHMNAQQLHDHSRNGILIGYRPSSTLDQYSDNAQKSENRIILNNRPYESDWSARRLASQKPESVGDRLPVLTEGSNLDLNTHRYTDYTNPVNNADRLHRDREIPINMISSTSSFIQTNT
ncbi:hypothetical protein MN116_007643 [Schistosoma mekongi]|uniref:Pro-neuregulin-2, membrane-bound n=1 Tax=Schistosoma mekongi TaxID=38744 RepID=A0AAE1Z6E2_SCHME|nr:hypothetical protein MN116_007643 [Schistosoma mekongi]